jgi:hypothetical protein
VLAAWLFGFFVVLVFILVVLDVVAVVLREVERCVLPGSRVDGADGDGAVVDGLDAASIRCW